MILFDVRALKAALKDDKLAAGVPKVLPELAKALDAIGGAFEVDVAPEGHANDPNWIAVPAEIPDPNVIASTINDVMRVLRPEQLSTLNVQEAFMVYIKVALLMGFVMASPWVFFQIWSFIAAGLYPHEKRLVNVYLPVSVGLFLGGFFICEFLDRSAPLVQRMAWRKARSSPQ